MAESPVGAGDVELREGVQLANGISSAMVENFLKFGGGFGAVVQAQVRKTANVKRPKVDTWPLGSKFIFSGRLKDIDGFGGFALS